MTIAESPVDLRWRCAGASAVGDRHLADGTPCQDAFRFARLDASVAVAAVADGVSTATAAAAGSALAAELAVHVLADHLRAGACPVDAAGWTTLLHEVLDDVGARIAGAAGTLLHELPRPASALRCTIAVAVVAHPWVVVAGIGDCFAIVGRTPTGTLHCVLTPSPAGQERDGPPTLPSDVAEMRVAVLLDPGVSSVLLATDGMSSALLEGSGHADERPSDAALRPLLQHLHGAGDPHALADMLLNHQDLRDRTGDDRTVAVLVREEPA